jgi:hypothetical protein
MPTEQDPPNDCRLDDRNDLVTQLNWLNSLESNDKVIELLANAPKEVRLSIMSTINPLNRREMYGNIAAFRFSKSVPYLSQELWDNIASNLSSFSTGNAVDLSFPFEFTEHQSIHECLWKTIFKDENWLQLAERYNIHPGLLASDLASIPEKIKKKERLDTDMVLTAPDWIGDFFWNQLEDNYMTLRNSLQPHTSHRIDNKTCQISFESGIRLNIRQAVTGCEIIEMPNLQVLFDRERLQTTYCPWITSKKEPIKTLKACDIIGKKGPITNLSDVNPICSVRLPYPRQCGVQQIFDTPTSGDLIPIYNDGEGYPTGRIQGWEERI